MQEVPGSNPTECKKIFFSSFCSFFSLQKVLQLAPIVSHWLPMAPQSFFKHPWALIAPICSQDLSRAPYGSQGLLIAPKTFPELPMAPKGFLWLPRPFSSSLWLPVAPICSQDLSRAPYGSQELPLAP